ncbi:MAG: 2-dehydropantoate 2-reductase [Acidobacteriaceae bacterium]
MHILVFGAGGVGGYFGGRLAQAGERVTFVARGGHLQAILGNGLHVESIKGDFTIQPVNATDDPSQVDGVDAVLMCVKTWQVTKAGKAIIPLLNRDTFVVPLENGVEAPSQLAEILGREHVLGGLCRIASHIASPGHIQHTGIEPYVAFGELDKRLTTRAQDLKQAFEGAGVWVEIPPDINVAMWQKYLFISTVSSIGAVTRVPIGDFRSHPETRQMMERALQDCYSLALAHGVQLPPESVANTLAFIDSLPPETIASMHRDIIEGCPSELDSQVGAIVQMGQMYNVSTPVHTFIYHSLLPQERLARSKPG